jgi:hypothetical protein
MVNGFKCFCLDDNTKKRPVSDNPMSAGWQRLKINREKAGLGTAPRYERTNLNAYPSCVGYAYRRPLFLSLSYPS